MKMNCPVCRTQINIVTEHTDNEKMAEALIRDAYTEHGFDVIMNAVEKRLVTDALQETNGNATAAAESLRIPFHSIRHLIKKHGLKK